MDVSTGLSLPFQTNKKGIAIRQLHKGGKTVHVKAELTNPKDQPKRKLEAYFGSDSEDDDGMSICGSVVSVTKGGKGKQPKASGSKAQAGGAASSTRKSMRLNSSSSTRSKKPRIESSRPESGAESLIRRLASQFAEIGKTYEELAEHVRG
jgi:hypothetical protein